MNKLAVAFAALSASCGAKSQPAPPPPPAPIDAGVDTGPVSEPESREKPRALILDNLTWERLTGVEASETKLARLDGDPDAEPASFLLEVMATGKSALVTTASDYHAVVVNGVIANSQDGASKPSPLPVQSYFYQPAGVAHALTCTTKIGTRCIVFVESTGRFGIAPAQPAKGAKRDPRYVEKRSKDHSWSPFEKTLPGSGQRAALWGDPSSQPNGMIVKLKAGETPAWHIHKTDYEAVVLAGSVTHTQSGHDPIKLLPGAYVWQPGGYKHTEACNTGGLDCVLYVSFSGALVTKPAE